MLRGGAGAELSRAIWHYEWQMISSAPKRFPVTVTHLPVTRCQLCQRTIAYRPGEASAVLTKHYNEKHKDELGQVPDARK
jgi:hypothetical protein